MLPMCTCQQAGPSALWEGQWFCTACYFKQANIMSYGCGDELSGYHKHRGRSKYTGILAPKVFTVPKVRRPCSGVGEQLSSPLRRL